MSFTISSNTPRSWARAGLEIADLTPETRGEWPPKAPIAVGESGLREDERPRILAALARQGGREAKAAHELGISRSTLWRKLYQHRLV